MHMYFVIPVVLAVKKKINLSSINGFLLSYSNLANNMYYLKGECSIFEGFQLCFVCVQSHYIGFWLQRKNFNEPGMIGYILIPG